MLFVVIFNVAASAASAAQLRLPRMVVPNFKVRGGGSGDGVLHTFATWPGASDGANPVSTLIADGTGALFGTAQGGGSGNGVVFKFTPPTTVSGTYTETVLYQFSGSGDGAHPMGGLVLDGSGAVYGTTASGGSTGAGVIFKLSPPAPGNTQWTQTVLHTFGTSPNATDGATPVAALLFMNGALYGTTENGGSAGYGVVFRLAPAGSNWIETVLHSFATWPGANDGANPIAGLISDRAGDLYGTTQGGGIGAGVAFALVPSGSAWVETVLHTFGTAPAASDCTHPAGGLLFGPGNGLYGTAMTGGSGNAGVAFELSFGGNGWAETVLHAFGTAPGSADGATPMSGLTSDASGNLYGTTFAGGKKYGVAYKLAIPQSGQPWVETVNCAFGTATGDGANPVAGLLFINDGLFPAGVLLGTTEGGGSGYGTLFNC